MRRQRAPSDEELFPDLSRHGIISVDCEGWDPELKTKGPGWHRDDTYISGVAIATEAGHRHYYAVGHPGEGNMCADKVFDWLQVQLGRADQPKVGAHLLYDIGFLGQEGIEVKGPLWDIQNAEPLLNENKFTYSLDSLSKQYLGIGKNDAELDDWVKSNINEKDAKRNPKRYIAKTPVSIATPYALADVDHPLKIFAAQRPELERQGLWNIFQIESRLIPLLYRMRKRGVPVWEVAGFLGHSSGYKTTERYAKFGPDHLAGAARAIDAYFADLGVAGLRLTGGLRASGVPGGDYR